MKALNFVIIKLAACLIIGILLAHLCSISLSYSLIVLAGAFAFLAITYHIANRQFQTSIWFGCSTYLVMIWLGIITYNLHDQKNAQQHYTKIQDYSNGHCELRFKIRERLKSSTYHDKYVIELLTINGQSVFGKSLLNIEKGSLHPIYKIDDVLLLYSDFKPLQKPLNPNQFDYKAYLKKQYIYHQIFTKNTSIFKISSGPHTLLGYAAVLRETINEKLNTFDFKPEEMAIINALILGQRQDMDHDIYTSYANAGAIHILAVSGLHVGIILLLLNIVFRPIERLKNGKSIKVIIILGLLWSFAVVAGLSASVTRAVTMFSIVAIAMHLKRPTNIYNTLAISVFVLLLFKPLFLFDVGFQMSYLAVLAIVSIQPLLFRLWQPKLKVVDYFWQIFTVTIAAQFGVVPISLYYFHQFPSLFFISNLAIIPFLGLILGFGILVIILALLNSLPEVIANVYGSIISVMNSVVSWVSRQEDFLFKDLSFEIPQVLVSYLLIIALVVFYKKKNFMRLAFLLFSVLTVQGVWIYNSHKTATNLFVIFHKSRFSVLAQKHNKNLSIWHDLDSITITKDKVLTNFKVGNFIQTTNEDTLKSIYLVGDKKLLVVDSLGIYEIKNFRPEYVLLRQSPRLNLMRLIDSLQPELIIADGSNYKSYVKRWEATCIKKNVPFYQTGKKGALIFK